MKSEIVKLTFKNFAQSNRVADIVLFQKNITPDSKIFAWHVIHNCSFNLRHYLEFGNNLDLLIRDYDGNQKIFQNIKKGLLYTYSKNDGISKIGESIDPEIVEVKNNLDEGTITAALCRSKKLIYAKTEICPDEIISFGTRNEIYIGRVETIKPGQVLNKNWLDRFTTKLNLEGIKSADLILRGGGFGPKAKKYYFKLENIKTN